MTRPQVIRLHVIKIVRYELARKHSVRFAPGIQELLKNEKNSQPEETTEIFAFLEAADESKRHGGVSVSPASVLAKASPEAASKLGR